MEEASDLLSVRPPEYWPSPHVFALADAADRFVLADTLQYSRQSFQNRAQLRTPQGWQWITIPLKGSQHGRPICDVQIRNRRPWLGKHWRALHFNYRTSPFFDFYEPQLRPLFETEWKTLGALTCTTAELLAELLGVNGAMVRASRIEERDFERRNVDGRGSRVDGRGSRIEGGFADVPSILAYFGTNRLLSSEEAAEVNRKFAANVHVLQVQRLEYRQNFEGFVPGMSTLDLLFNYGPETLSMIRRASSSLGEVLGID